MNTPILLCVYRRLDKVVAVLDSLKLIKPTHLYISANAPKNDAEKEYTDAIKKAIDKQITWECTVYKKYEDHHINSCSESIVKGIDWFFSQVEYGIILEDDCIAHPSFFEFSSILLEKHKNDESVYQISGTNINFDHDNPPKLLSTNFSFPNWGWATWRRCWAKYSHEMNNWEAIKDIINNKTNDKEFWEEFLTFNAKTKTAWDIQWNIDIWTNGGNILIPSFNTVSNIGFGYLATHTSNDENLGANLPTKNFIINNASFGHADDNQIEKKIIHLIKNISSPKK
ncbi:MAG: hypothetical protein JNM51_06195 [Bacteroidia bacterium]|nr:hypothetical protein [Bacteroidia bacterium]